MQQVFSGAVSGLDTTPAVTAKQLAAQRAAAKREKALRSIAANTDGTRNVAASEYGLSGRWAKVTVLAPSGRGRNARGLAGSKRGWGGSAPKGAKRAKRQRVGGNAPVVSATRWSNV